jgi:hypothetical protein
MVTFFKDRTGSDIIVVVLFCKSNYQLPQEQTNNLFLQTG